jgi:tetratricopeptide (TPR) repeat protein
VAVIVIAALGSSAGLVRLARLFPALTSRIRQAAFGFVALIVVAFSVATVRRNTEYRSGLSIWETVVSRSPHARAHENLAVQLRDAGRDDEAIAELRKAAPDLADAKHALGSALLERHDFRGARTQLEAFVRERPGDPEIVSAREELAAAFLGEADRESAITQYQAIIAVAPQYARGHLALADLLLEAKNVQGAATEYRQYLRLRPNDAEAHNLLGVALASGHDLTAAAEEFAVALQLNPRLREARENLTHARQGGPPLRDRPTR